MTRHTQPHQPIVASHTATPSGGLLSTKLRLAFAALGLLLMLAAPQAAFAEANAVIPTSSTPGDSPSVINNYAEVTFPRNDDGTWPCGGEVSAPPACPGPQGQEEPEAYPLGFNINFFGTMYSAAFVNNNGNVTFTGPLSQFTPTELTTFGSPIIAPFFADVDTRGAASGIVNFGQGTLAGKKVFVVNWPKVGCYPEVDSVLDNFQMILIDRPEHTGPDGDNFEIEFNYNSIEWDTGQASGGDTACQDGPPGNSAYVGFTNGTDTAGDSSEVPGSGVPNAFLNTTSATGLIYHDLDSTTPGRYIIPVVNGATTGPSGGTYVALGDSYSAGQGNPTGYLAGTNVPNVDVCHRSTWSYPFQAELALGYYSERFSFHACSGAIIQDFYKPFPANHKGENPSENQPQLHWLEGTVGKDASLVTLTIGGNNAHFAEVLEDCYLNTVGLNDIPCQIEWNSLVNSAIQRMGEDTPGNRESLTELYKNIAALAPNATTLILGYPRFFPAQPPLLCGTGALGSQFERPQMQWMNDEERSMDNTIARAVRETLDPHIRYIETYEAFRGHERCEAEPYLNGVKLKEQVGSFHPNEKGQAVLAALVEKAAG
jgi:GDSL-like lipase/acylhydrolase family protein/nidogen-like